MVPFSYSTACMYRISNKDRGDNELNFTNDLTESLTDRISNRMEREREAELEKALLPE